MPQKDEQKIKEIIREKVAAGLSKLPNHLKTWGELHLIEPKRITVYNSVKSCGQDFAWLITDHNGIKDSGYRVVYNEELKMFGLIMNLTDGRIYCLGYSGDFDQAIEGM